jgi:hypothetical protein
MRRLALVAIAFGLTALAAHAASAEQVARYDVAVFLSRSAAFTVEERIAYDFGAEQRHGIERWIPVAYGRGYAADYRIALDVESVTDERGAELRVSERRDGANRVLRIGDPDVTVSGLHEYRIRYSVRRGILWLKDHDEVYWNATGSEWRVPIAEASARVYLPPGVESAGLGALCFTGPQGSVATDCSIERASGSLGFAATRPLGVHEGLTFTVALPKGALPEPTPLAKWIERASDFLSAWLLVPIGAFAAMFSLWWREGRDPESPNAAIAVRYEPPEGLAPAEVGTVLDERVDVSDVTATIVDLAVHGVLRIHEEESRTLVFFTQRDYTLEKLREPSDRKPFEQLLVQRLFVSGDRVRVADLRNKFYRDLPGIRTAIYAGLSGTGGWFAGNPEEVKTRWGVAGVFAIVVAVGATMLTESWVAGGSCIAAGLCVLGFGLAMPRRTLRGRRAQDEIEGLREFIERVDADRLAREGARTKERFEALLPYAIVLRCADAWAGAFADIYDQPPTWYASPRYGHGAFSPRGFVGDMGQGLGAIGSAMTTAPRSSGSGSSGFGGGGSSGGGFGGGGGGSW